MESSIAGIEIGRLGSAQIHIFSYWDLHVQGHIYGEGKGPYAAISILPSRMQNMKANHTAYAK